MSLFTLVKTNKKNKKRKKYSNIKIPWVEKYRPNQISDVILDDFIRIKMERIVKDKSIPNLIITGEPSTGKTSTILAIAKKIYDKKQYENNVLELNASDDRGLNIITNTILPFCKMKIDKKIHKLIILDEADSITSKAQNLLSNIITEFKNNNRFVFICNDCSKLNESIQSKCMIIKFPNINKKSLKKKIKNICEKENIQYTSKGLKALIFVSNNDIRQSINNLECIYNSYDLVTEDNVYKFVDMPKPYYINNIIKFCFDGNLKESFKIINELIKKGYSPNDILLTFMKCLTDNDIDLDEETKLKLYEIISLSYIKVNDGIDTILQLYGCISKIHLFLFK
jgi:replication factor C subunit 2/4